ncbi:hypothetical protein IVB03_00875 [Bradyrhizobium sp. 168]|uniref:hypothetical protein n=1 Tax=Bradyrhizobium sp. 168 TaxID=2782639 RepID=UPI001FFB5D05|nr:hypothetical protein [Bradyrhizobium sp. 168]MCK1578165.1 hypothetical protein [Bradyrhizobium sp. 168]
MTAHYGVTHISAANKNAINVVLALWIGDNPAVSQNVSEPANQSGDIGDAATYWFSGRPYDGGELSVFQSLPGNMPVAIWPVQGVAGPVSEAEAIAAAAALIVTMTTRDSYTMQEAQETLAASLSALGLRRAESKS